MIKDNTPVHLSLAFSEGFNAIVGLTFMVYFFIKYYRLNKVNTSAKNSKRGDEAKAAFEDIRKELVVQLTSKVELENPRKKRGLAGNLYNKNQALRQSKNFQMVRNSISTSMDAVPVNVTQATGTVLTAKQE